MSKKCDEFLEAVKNVPFESRTYLELACALEDSKKELEAKNKVIDELKELELNDLLGEACLALMLQDSELSVNLDLARGVIKRLLTNKDKGVSDEDCN